ncbi:nuclear transport factor 2 family protein [Nonomuraea sp. NPDC050202]|jgi:hypothetical protein|uniref:nuclear transport factor 2 family protein n=1 Tax=Nonomuraea sp. NPDC050202 TaxID=3155035 RepID=UPI003404BDFC
MSAEARHHIANVLHTYTDIADRKDVEAAVALLGSARVTFPAGGFDRPGRAAEFFTGLWASPLPHRHDVSNLVVTPGGLPRTWTARAHYTRWVFDPAPVLHTLGEYTMVVQEEDWLVTELTVTRTWTTI